MSLSSEQLLSSFGESVQNVRVRATTRSVVATVEYISSAQPLVWLKLLHRVESECINGPPIIHKSHATKVTIQTSWHSQKQAKVNHQLQCAFNFITECFFTDAQSAFIHALQNGCITNWELPCTYLS